MMMGLSSACVDGIDPVDGSPCYTISNTVIPVPAGVTTGPPAPGNIYDPSTGALTVPSTGSTYIPTSGLTLQYNPATGQNQVVPVTSAKDNSMMYIALAIAAFGLIAIGRHG